MGPCEELGTSLTLASQDGSSMGQLPDIHTDVKVDDVALFAQAQQISLQAAAEPDFGESEVLRENQGWS